MKFLPPEPPIVLYEEGFGSSDVLDRKRVGKALSNLVARIDDPVVIALDGRWGTGKSYFLKRWVGAHKLENDGKATTVYFDAFANDYLSDPLPALVSALSDRISPSENEKLAKLKAAAFKVMKPLARAGVALATYGASEVVNGAGEALIASVSDDARAGIDRYWEHEEGRRHAIQEFRLAISSLVDAGHKGDEHAGASLVVVIDELDRCRPDYALELLEVLKHFFDVPGVQFVLGVNMKALENSVVARYGSNIDAEAYLKKFINIVLNLPSEVGDKHTKEPASLVYLDYLMNQMGTPKHLAPLIKTHIKMIRRTNFVSVREVGKIVSSVSLLREDVLQKDNWFKGYLEVAVTLVISRVLRPALFEKFVNATISDSELLDYFGATKSTITETIDGELNKDYHHPTFWAYMQWKFLVNNGRIEESEEGLTRAIVQQFDNFGRLHDAQSIPRMIHRDWLDLFEFYAS